MSKTIPALLQAHLNTGCTTLAHGIRVTALSGAVWAATSHDEAATIDGTTYQPINGFDVRSLSSSSGLEVDNTELQIIFDDSDVTRQHLLSGLWANAEFAVIRYNWASLTDGVETLMRGTLGQFRMGTGGATVELRGLQQMLQQPVGNQSSITCRARLGDALCTVDLVPLTVTGTLTAVTSKQVFRDAGRTEAVDYFAEGTLTWTSGLNDGLTRTVRDYAANGTMTLLAPMVLDVQVGDTYSMVPGCRKRLAEDCVAKFDNVLNFQGEPHRPMPDALTSNPADI